MVILLLADAAIPPVADALKVIAYLVRPPAASVGELGFTATPVTGFAATIEYDDEVSADGSDVVDTVSVFAPAPGLVTPLATPLTLWPAAIAVSVNSPHVSTVPLAPQLPIDVVDETVVS